MLKCSGTGMVPLLYFLAVSAIASKNSKKKIIPICISFFLLIWPYNKHITIQWPLIDTIGIISYSLVRNACLSDSPLSVEDFCNREAITLSRMICFIIRIYVNALSLCSVSIT